MEQAHIELSRQGDEARILVKGPFNFGARHGFVRARDALFRLEGARGIKVDLRLVTAIDSAALGMLLIMRERAIGERMSVALVTRPGIIRQILEVARFGERFVLH